MKPDFYAGNLKLLKVIINKFKEVLDASGDKLPLAIDLHIDVYKDLLCSDILVNNYPNMEFDSIDGMEIFSYDFLQYLLKYLGRYKYEPLSSELYDTIYHDLQKIYLEYKESCYLPWHEPNRVFVDIDCPDLKPPVYKYLVNWINYDTNESEYRIIESPVTDEAFLSYTYVREFHKENQHGELEIIRILPKDYDRPVGLCDVNGNPIEEGE